MEENKKPICCFCGKECEDEFGNNPYLANTEEDARCCNECNTTVVIPTRIEELVKINEDKSLSIDEKNLEIKIDNRQKGK